MQQLKLLASIGLAVGCMAPADDNLTETQSTVTIGEAYNAIRAQEANFPIPTSAGTVVVGTFNGATGAFTGLVSEYDWVIDDLTGKPKQHRIIPHADLDAVNVSVRFNVTNRGTQSLSVIANGVTFTAPAGQSYVVADIGPVNTVNWTLQLGTHTRSDILHVDRPYIVGAGVFTVKALPISIIYEPPQDLALLNEASYSIVQSIANTMTMSLKEESSTTKSAKPSKYQNVADIKTAINALVTVLGPAPNVPNKAAVVAALNAISSSLGTVSAQQTNGTADSTESSLSIRDTWSATMTTDAHLGPGEGDRILYLKNARFVWLSIRGQLSIALLGFDSHATEWVKVLQDDLDGLPWFPTRGAPVLGDVTGLDRESLTALLALDPFVAGGPLATLPSSRFVPASPSNVSGSGGDDTYSISHSVTTTDKSASSTFNTHVTDARAGWLSFLGIGVTETASTKLTTTHTQTRELSVSETVTTTLKVFTTGSEHYSIDIFYDRVFGGFAFRQGD